MRDDGVNMAEVTRTASHWPSQVVEFGVPLYRQGFYGTLQRVVD